MNAQSTASQTTPAMPVSRTHTFIGVLVSKKMIRGQVGQSHFTILFHTDALQVPYERGLRVKFQVEKVRVAGVKGQQDYFVDRAVCIQAAPEKKVKLTIPVIPVQVEMPELSPAATEEPETATVMSDYELIKLQLGGQWNRAEVAAQPMTGVVTEDYWTGFRILGPDYEEYLAESSDFYDVHPVDKTPLQLRVGDKVTFYPGVRRVPVVQGRRETYPQAHAYGIRLADRSIVEALRPKTKKELLGQRLVGHLILTDAQQFISYFDGPTELDWPVPPLEHFHPLALVNGWAVHGLVLSFQVGEDGISAVQPLIRLLKVELQKEAVEVTVLRFYWDREPQEESILLDGLSQLSKELLEFDSSGDSKDRKANRRLRDKLESALGVIEQERQLAAERQEQQQKAVEREALRQVRRQALIAQMQHAEGMEMLQLGDDDVVRDGTDEVHAVNFLVPGYDLSALLALISVADEKRYEI